MDNVVYVNFKKSKETGKLELNKHMKHCDCCSDQVATYDLYQYQENKLLCKLCYDTIIETDRMLEASKRKRMRRSGDE